METTDSEALEELPEDIRILVNQWLEPTDWEMHFVTQSTEITNQIILSGYLLGLLTNQWKGGKQENNI